MTVTATFDEQIDPNVAPAFFTATGARIEPKQVYYNVVTYELVVGSTVPALDGALQITVGPVADVVGNAQASGFVTAVFAEGKTVTTQSASSAAALDAMWGNGYNVGYSCVTSSDNALDDRVAGPSHTFTLTLQASTALEVASASVAGVAAADDGSDVTVVLGASDSNVANGKVTVTRVVPADATAADNSGFVDGASVNWKLSLVTSTACLGDVGTTCLVKFDVSACPAVGALTVAGGVATVAQWEERVYVDLSPPVITSVRLVSSSSPEDGPVVRHSETAAVTFVATEPLVNGGAASLVAPDARLVAESCGEVSYAAASAEVQTAVVPVGNGVAANTYTATFTLDDALAIAPASCQTSLLCLDFLDDATDAAGNALATTRYCLGFGDLLTRREPGWLFYDNVAAPTSVAVAKVPHACADLSVSAAAIAACAADSEAAATHPGSWFTVTLSSSTPTALEKISFGGVPHVTELPDAGRAFVLSGCADLAPVARCEAFAARRGACEAFLCPDCEWRHSCDRSCGLCQTGRGAGTGATITLATSEFPGLNANAAHAVSAEVRTAGKLAAALPGDATLAYEDFTPGLAAATSCAGRCGGVASSGCGCDASCVVAGDCCADAGLCCSASFDSPSEGASGVAGGCLLPPALALTTAATSWAERDDGVVTSDTAAPGSTVYVLITANKPVEVSSATVGGVAVAAKDIAIEYDVGATALERSARAAARVAYAAGDSVTFAKHATDIIAARERLPKAAIPYAPGSAGGFSRVYPDVPATFTSLLRIDGQSLVPQPDGALPFSVALAEKSYHPLFTDGHGATVVAGSGPVWRNAPVLVTITGTKVSGPGASGVVTVGSVIEVDATSNVDVVVTSFSVAAVPLTCRGVRYGGDAHGTCAVDPRLEWPDPADLAEYRSAWKGTRAFDAREREFLASGALRACVGVVDVAGNKASTCVDLASLTLDVSPPTCLAPPALISASPTSATFAVRMSEAGTVKWTARACQRGGASGDACDAVDASVDAVTGQTAVTDAPAETSVRVDVPASWLAAPGDGVVQVEWELCDEGGECGPCAAEPAADAYLPAATAPTLVPTLLASEPTSASFSLQHGDGSTTACWAVLETAEATSAADAPARTKEQTCAPTSSLFTGDLWCGGTTPVAQAHTCAAVVADSDERPVQVTGLTSASHYCLYAAPATGAAADAASVVCFSTADDTPPTFTVVRGTSRRCPGNKIVGPKCGLVVGVIASECVTQPAVTLTWAAGGQAAFDALPASTKPAMEVFPTSGRFAADANCDTHWTFTYAPGLAPYLPSGALDFSLGGCTDMAPFGVGGAPASLSATQGPNACPTTTDWIGADVEAVVIDNTAPSPIAVTTVRDPATSPCELAGGDAAVITVTFDEETSRPTFTCMGNAVAPERVTAPGATALTTLRYSLSWAARCVVPRGLEANTALEYTYTALEDRYGNVDDTVYTETSVDVPAGTACVIESTTPILTLADFDQPVRRPGQTTVLSLQFSEVVAQPPVTIGGVAMASGAFAVTAGATTDGALADAWTVTTTVALDALDGPLAFTVGPDVEDKYGNKNSKTYVRPVGPDSDRPLVDGTPPVLRLVSFVSDNAFDDKLAVPGDTLRLTFEANELVSAPAVTLGAGAGAAAAAVSPVHRAGVAARGFARPAAPATYAATWVAEVTVTDSFTPASGDIGWAATGHADVAGNVGTSGACDDWLPACAATRATQSALERDASPTIDAASGDAVDAYDVSTFVQLDPVTTMYTLYEQKANVSSPARVGAASEQALRDALLNFDRDAGAWFLAQHVSTSRLLFQLGGACGAASGPNCRGSCGTCDDAAVRSRVDNHVNGAASNLAVDGEGDRGGACAPTLRASADDDTLVTTWFVAALDARRISKPVVRFTDVAGGVFFVPPRTSPPPTEWRGRRSDRRSPRTRARRVLTRASATASATPT